MKKIAIVGAGGFGREVKTLIDDINQNTPTFEFIGFFDSGKEKGSIVNGYPVLGKVIDLLDYDENLDVVIAVGDPNVKKRIVNKLSFNSKINFPNIISPRAFISDDDISLGIGNIICAGTILTCNIKIENFVILNLHCTVGHDTRIKSFSSFMPAVNISGEVDVQEGVYVGTGAKVINLLNIGEYSIIGAGAVIIRDVPDGATVVGNPGKVIKERVFSDN